MLFYIFNAFVYLNLEKIRDLDFLDLMIYNFIDVSMMCHVMVFGAFVEEKIPVTIFWVCFKFLVVKICTNHL